MFNRITANLSGASLRWETLNGRRYAVAPTVALTVGVHAGNNGPLLYKGEQLAKSPHAWNHKPIILHHPQGSDTACEQAVLERQGLGMILNASYDGRLKWDSWLDEERVKAVAPEVLERLGEGKAVEISTGIFHDLLPQPGTWNSESYTAEVVNIVPDHLAVLPDQQGACSVQDGAGLLRNAAAPTQELSFDDIKEQIRSLLREGRSTGTGPCDDYCYVCDLFPKYAIYESGSKCYKLGYKVKAGKVSIDAAAEEVRKLTSYVTANGGAGVSPRGVYVTANGVVISRNEEHQGPLRLPLPSEGELSDPMRRQQLQSALKEKYGGIQQEGDWGGYVTDLVANYVVWSKDGKHFRLPYTYDDDKINFDGEPEEVERVTEYRARQNTPIDGTQSPNTINTTGDPMPNPTPPTPNKRHLDAVQRLAVLASRGQLTLNAIHQGAHELLHDATGHSDAHLAPGGQSDGQVRTTAGGARKEEVNKMIAGGHAKEEDRTFLEGLPDDHFASVSKFVTRGATTPVVPYTYEGVHDRSNVHASQNSVQNAEQFIAGAPPEIAELLREGLTQQQQRKATLVQVITGNRSNRFNPAWLNAQRLPMLEGLAALVSPQGGQPQHVTANYGGQADVPMFLDPAAPNAQDATQNAQDDVLPIPGGMFELRQQTA